MMIRDPHSEAQIAENENLGVKYAAGTALMMIRCPHVFCPHPTRTEGLGKSPFITVRQTALKQSKWGQAQLLVTTTVGAVISKHPFGHSYYHVYQLFRGPSGPLPKPYY